MTSNILAGICAAWLAVGIAVPAPALAQICAPSRDKAMEGMYVLEGVHETGSRFVLHSHGGFQYELIYGALDEYAEGCWRREGDVLILRPTSMRTGPGGERFRELRLARSADGRWARRFDARRTGHYRKSGSR